VRRRSLQTLAAVAVIAAAALAGFTPGCKKEKESLILVDIDAVSANGTSVADLEIRVNDVAPPSALVVARFFSLPSTGLAQAVQYGVYIPAGATGSLLVTAIARPVTGCAGFIASKTVKVVEGATTPVVLTMRPEPDVCNVTGTGGAGGITGTGGAGGSSTSCPTTIGPKAPPAAPPTTLANCVEIDHNASGAACDPAGFSDSFVYDVQVSPDGQLLATAGTNGITADAVVRIWRMQGNTPVPCGPMATGPGIGPAYAAFSPDGQYFAIAWRTLYVDLYRLPNFEYVTEIRSAPGSLYGVAFSPDSKTVFTLDYDSTLYDGNIYADRLDGTPITSRLVGVDPDVLAISPVMNGSNVTLAVGGFIGDASVLTFNGSTFSAPTILATAPAAASWGAAFSPDGQLLAVGTDDGTVRFWAAPFTSAAQSGAPIVAGSSTSVITGISFAPGGTYVALAFGTEMDIWNVSTRAFVSRRNTMLPTGVPTSYTQYVDSLTFSASGGALIGGQDLCGKVLVCTD
jgi:WD40 domain-containing protein